MGVVGQHVLNIFKQVLIDDGFMEAGIGFALVWYQPAIKGALEEMEHRAAA